jgi:hypothetical protein
MLEKVELKMFHRCLSSIYTSDKIGAILKHFDAFLQPRAFSYRPNSLSYWRLRLYCKTLQIHNLQIIDRLRCKLVSLLLSVNFTGLDKGASLLCNLCNL